MKKYQIKLNISICKIFRYIFIYLIIFNYFKCYKKKEFCGETINEKNKKIYNENEI